MTQKPDKQGSDEERGPSGAWIPMRTGVALIAILSVFMAVLSAWQAVPINGWVNGILWGLFQGGLIWVLFLGMYAINRWLRK